MRPVKNRAGLKWTEEAREGQRRPARDGGSREGRRRWDKNGGDLRVTEEVKEGRRRPAREGQGIQRGMEEAWSGQRRPERDKKVRRKTEEVPM